MTYEDDDQMTIWDLLPPDYEGIRTQQMRMTDPLFS